MEPAVNTRRKQVENELRIKTLGTNRSLEKNPLSLLQQVGAARSI